MTPPIRPQFLNPDYAHDERKRLLRIHLQRNRDRLNQLAEKWYNENQDSDLSDDELQAEAENYARRTIGDEILPTIEGHLDRVTKIQSEPDRSLDDALQTGSGVVLPKIERRAGTGLIGGLVKGAARGAVDPFLNVLAQTKHVDPNVGGFFEKVRDIERDFTEIDPGNVGSTPTAGVVGHSIGELAGSALPWAAAGRALSLGGRVAAKAAPTLAKGADKVLELVSRAGQKAGGLFKSPTTAAAVREGVGAVPRMVGQTAVFEGMQGHLPSEATVGMGLLGALTHGAGAAKKTLRQQAEVPFRSEPPVAPAPEVPIPEPSPAAAPSPVRPMAKRRKGSPGQQPDEVIRANPDILLETDTPGVGKQFGEANPRKRVADLTRKAREAGATTGPQRGPGGRFAKRVDSPPSTGPEGAGASPPPASNAPKMSLDELTRRGIARFQESGEVPDGFGLRAVDGQRTLQVINAEKAAAAVGGGATPAPKFRGKRKPRT